LNAGSSGPSTSSFQKKTPLPARINTSLVRRSPVALATHWPRIRHGWELQTNP